MIVLTDAPDLLRLFALALCVWREARNQSFLGQLLVAQVVENRVRDPRWPDTYVSVITQRWQFSAFTPGDPNATKFPTETDVAWSTAVAAARAILDVPVALTSANHYHTTAVSPGWKDDTKITNREGDHVFYRL